MRVELISGAGNLFVLWDARGSLAGGDVSCAGAVEGSSAGLGEPAVSGAKAGGELAGARAAALCEQAAELGGRAADGVLVLLDGAVGEQGGEPGGAGGRALARMVVWNADGSLAAACGNGLRCCGWYLMREKGLTEVQVETESGLRWVRGAVAEDGAAELVAELGPVRVERLGGELELWAGEREAWRGAVGNPHCVFLVEDVRAGDFLARGASLQAHQAFRGGVNVGYVARDGADWRLRVYERGVGETEACGTGAAAAAWALHEGAGVPFPIDLELRGGRLRVTRVGADGAWVAGPVEHLGSLVESPATGPLE